MKNKKRSNPLRKFMINRSIDLEQDQHCFNKTPVDCLIAIQFSDGHVHHLLPNEIATKDLLEDIIASEGLAASVPSKDSPVVKQRPIILKNRQAVGDILMMTCVVRDMKTSFPDWPINVSTTAMHIWDNNPYLDRSLTTENAELVEIGPSFLTNASNRDDRHFANAFRISVEDKLGISIKQGAIKPDIWLTEEEIKTPIIEPPYWIIVAGEKGDWTAKTYPFDRWQKITEELSDVKFVQIGAKEHRHPSLTGDNIINYIGKTQDRDTGIRDLFRLFYFAEGSMGLVSFQMHLAAAFGMPCIVIAGAREPARFTRFPNHQYLCTDGCLPCASITSCWHCDLSKTCPEIITGPTGQKYPKCVDIIKTEDVLRAFHQFYEGKRLSFDHPREPVLPNAVVKESVAKVINLIPERKREEGELRPEDFGFKWGGACITEPDWIFLRKILKKYKVKTVLEFGSGLSTVMMSAYGMKVVTYETKENWTKDLKSKEIDKVADLRSWNGKLMQDKLGKFDLAIVDGPPGGQSRELSTKLGSECADIVLVHDAGREWERKWQDKYLKDTFTGPGKGGTRWHLWVKNAIAKEEEDKKEVSRIKLIESGVPLFRLFCNTRGDGGAGRSIDWFMNGFLDLGWNVEYVYSNPQPSGTYRRCGSPKIMATNNLDRLRAPCDIFLLATDDFVWEFKKDYVAEMMSGMQAKRKVMYINYRIGDVGKVPWTQEFDEWLFLNSELESVFRANFIGGSPSTKVIAPPADLTEYLKINPDYGDRLKIIRHSSQGNAKYTKDFNEKVEKILDRFPDATIRLMPAPSFLADFGDRVICHKVNDPSVSGFLPMGNAFWYNLPEGYTEGGPRVLLEAMASGLSVVTGNHSGPKDRVTEKTGFLCDSFEEELEAFDELSSASTRERMGKAAKERARIDFDPQRWIEAILGE